MGLQVSQTGSSKMYLNAYADKIVLNYNKKEDLEEKIESLGLDVSKIQTRHKLSGVNKGDPVFYYSFEFINGMIDDIVISEPSWGGEALSVIIKDVDETYHISLDNVFSSASKCFIRRLGNLDVSKEVSFGAWQSYNDENDKTYSGVRMYQGNKEKVEYAIPFKDLVKPISKKVGSKTEWDFSEQDNSLYGVLTEFIETNFRSTLEDNPTNIPQQEEETNTSLPQSANDDDGFPF